jgi:hypothetical protein
VLLESVKELKIQDTFSHTSPTESESANLELFSSKTLKESSQPRQQTENQFSSMSSESWKAWVTEQRQEYSQRLKSARLTRESESSSLGWQTPTTMDIERTPEGMEKRKAYRESIGRKYVEGCLTEQVKNWSTPTVMDTANIQKPRKKNPSGGQKPPLCQEVKNWPTATARDWKGCGNATTRKDGKHRIDNLEAVIKYGHLDQANHSTTGKSQGSWSTPQARDWKGAEGRAYKGQTKDLPAQTEAQGKLNPDWVEQLMGLPVGWTDLGSWEME